MATDQGFGKGAADTWTMAVAAEDAAYREALGDLVICLRHGLHLEETSLEALIDAEDTAQDQKAMVMGLKQAGLIDDEQAAWAIGYRWDLGGA